MSKATDLILWRERFEEADRAGAELADAILSRGKVVTGNVVKDWECFYCGYQFGGKDDVEAHAAHSPGCVTLMARKLMDARNNHLVAKWRNGDDDQS